MEAGIMDFLSFFYVCVTHLSACVTKKISPMEKILQAISKMQITFKDKARADEKAEHT